MFRSIVVLIGGLASLSSALLFAQEAVLGQKYGGGVHAYFAGDYLKSYEQLTAAIHGGTKDPRAYYFRGLTYLKLGRPQEAVVDFRKGAELESLDSNKFYNASKALERVQGSARMELETYRVDARMAALEETEKINKTRYEAIQLEESRVLREQALSAPPEPIDTPAPVLEPAATANPFDASDEKPAAKADKKADKSKKAKSTEEEPAEKPADKAPPAGEDPFNVKPDKPAKKAAPEKADENPFATEPEKPAAKDKPAEKKADEKKPAEEKADPDNPFQDEPAGDQKPAEK